MKYWLMKWLIYRIYLYTDECAIADVDASILYSDACSIYRLYTTRHNSLSIADGAAIVPDCYVDIVL